ncbi:MAG: hypothetical protein AAGI28_07045, partial [Pseudomonadota bacterium]
SNGSLLNQDGDPTGIDGIANEATVTQAGIGGFSEAIQTGDNQLTVVQTAVSEGMNSEVIQVNAGGGASNVALVEQEGIGSGFGSGTGSFIEQVGAGGKVRVTQDDQSVDATSVVFQSGLINRATVLQFGPPPFIGSGENNFSIIDQSGEDHSTLAFQVGDNNSASLIQSNVDNGTGLVQSGSTNTSLAVQSGVDGLLGIEQDGDENNSSATQSGNTNLIDLLQEGSLNDSLVVQSGTSNVIDVMQLGDGNFSSVNQSGTGSSVSVTQSTP